MILLESEKHNTAKDFLKQAKRYDTLINNKQEELDWLFGIATKVTASWSGETVSGSKSQDKLGDVTARIIDLQKEIGIAIDNLVDKRQEINALIDSVSDLQEMRVLRLFYIGLWDKEEGSTQYLTWSEIAKKMRTSERTVQRIHGSALQTIERILKGGTG